MEIVPIVVAVVGTLVGALATHALANRAESKRRKHEDQTRWLSDQRTVYALFVAEALGLERELWSAASLLDRDSRDERLPGYTTVLLTPERGVLPVLDETARSILVEAVESGLQQLSVLEVHLAEITLMSDGADSISARDLVDSLGDVVGLVEAFAPFDEAADAVKHARAARDRFIADARESLRAQGGAVVVDDPAAARPRSLRT